LVPVAHANIGGQNALQETIYGNIFASCANTLKISTKEGPKIRMGLCLFYLFSGRNTGCNIEID
jgi:hypothetical protein